MYSALPIFALLTFAAAVPAPYEHDAAWDALAQQGTIVNEGPWVEDLSYKRGPKKIAKPTAAKASSFWAWDR